MLESENVVYVPLKDWKLGSALGSYEPSNDTIYILINDGPEMAKALEHERIHRSRRNKPTFKLARVINTPIVKTFVELFLFFTAIYGLMAINIEPERYQVFTPFLSMAVIYLASLFSKLYEEKQANRGES